MIYDCFSFFNELDLLEIRLNVLKDVVDRFVLVEATRTHTGKEKPLYYRENAARFAAFADRIVHVVVDDFSLADTLSDVREKAWAIENLQRNAIVRGLADARADDRILISDLDEIPDPAAVARAVALPGVTRLGMRLYNYYLNYRNYSTRQWNLGTQVLRYGDFVDPALYAGFVFDEFVVEGVNTVPSASMVRFLKPRRMLKDAGWHFSYLGGVEAVKNKIRSIAHTEFDNETTTTDDWITARIAAGEDLFRRGDRFFAVDVKREFPGWLTEILEKRPQLLFPVTEELLRRVRWMKRFALCRGWLRRMIVRCIPRRLVPFFMKVRGVLSGVRQ